MKISSKQNKRPASRQGSSSSPAEEMDEDQQNGGVDQDLHALFLSQLGDVYNAEQQLTKALPKMAKTAESDELRDAFESHLDETRQHVSRLEQVIENLDEIMKRKTCAAMKGLIEEADEIAKERKDSSALDAALIAAAQKVEHYEIATYGTLIAWARQMGHDEAVEMLEEILDEEKAADERLTSVAEAVANCKG